MKILLVLALFLIYFAPFCHGSTRRHLASIVPSSEMQALQDLYSATNGPDWNCCSPSGSIAWNFTNTSVNPCVDKWQGIACIQSSSEYYVSLLNLTLVEMHGTLPTSIGKLSRLVFFAIEGNYISGPIPDSIGNLTALEYLSLTSNYISGTIPDVFGNMSLLSYLAMGGNILSGRLPNSIGNLSSLTTFVIDNCGHLSGPFPSSLLELPMLRSIDLSGNVFDGSLPSALDRLSDLLDLRLESNRFTGQIPESIGQMKALALLSLYYNDLTGSIPSTFGQMSGLLTLMLYSNDLTGTIPETLGQLTKLEYLDIVHTSVSGTIPASLGNCSSMEGLDLSSNELTGSFPSALSSMRNLRFLQIYNNVDMNGTLPSSYGSLEYLEYINIGFNSVGGSLPSAWGSLRSLSYLLMKQNFLTGPIPTSFGNLSQLLYLNIYENSLSGTIPSSLGRLSKLQQFNLNVNHLTGSVPTALCSCSDMTYFKLSSNSLTGAIPTSIGNLTGLVYLYLDSNSLTGMIPPSISDLVGLTYLSLFTNSLSGPVPNSFQHLTGLKILYLYENLLTGTIPSSLGKLTQLDYLFLAFNSLQGSIPSGLGNLTGLYDLYLFSNSLSGSIPSELANMLNLQGLYLDNNELTGSLPSTLGNLNKLKYLYLYNNHLSGTLPDNIGVLSKLVDVYFASNSFTGTIPSVISSISTLSNIDLSNNLLSGSMLMNLEGLTKLKSLAFGNNHLSGSIGSSLSALSALSELVLIYNAFTGALDDLTNSSVQLSLAHIQLNNNQFTGTIPADVFKLATLKTFVVATNCFHGSLPSSICDNSNLESLILDGLSSASSCQHVLFPGVSSTYVLQQSVGGEVPSCLFQLPAISTIHLSGNQFDTALPSIDSGGISDSLSRFVISHNQLPGDLQQSFQEKYWTELDVSYNRLSGSLMPRNGWSSTSTSLSLENNRLSGDIPGMLQGFVDINMLGTNLFSCGLTSGDVPEHDNGRKTYHCGSSAFNVQYYIWIGCVLILLLILTVVTQDFIHTYFGIASNQQHVIKWLKHTEQAGGTTVIFTDVGRILAFTLRFAVCCTSFIIVFLLPTYGILSLYYGTFTHQYAYVVSAAFMTGKVPFAIEFTAWTCLTAGVLLMFMAFFHPSTSSSRSSTMAEQPTDTLSKSFMSTYQSNCITMAYVMIDLLVVIGVNACYVYVVIYGDNSYLVIEQIVLSFFKLLWNGPCGPVLLKLIVQYFAPDVVFTKDTVFHFINLQILVSLINNVLVPLLVVMGISPSCFYNFFVPAPDVTFTYTDDECVQPWRTNCLEYVQLQQSISYTPPFTYDYQCSSSFITYYSPTYVSMCLIVTVAVPMARLIVLHLHTHFAGTRMFILWDAVLPPLLKPMGPGHDIPDAGDLTHTTKSCEVKIAEETAGFNSNVILIVLCTMLGLLLTFGTVFPALAPPLTLAIFVTIYVSRIEMGRFISAALECQLPQHVRNLELDCCKLGEGLYLQSVSWMLVSVSCLFYTMFLFDTLGGAVGFEGASWVLIVFPLLPLVMWLLLKLVHQESINNNIRHTANVPASATSEEKVTELTSNINSYSKDADSDGDTEADCVEQPTYNVLVKTI